MDGGGARFVVVVACIKDRQIDMLIHQFADGVLQCARDKLVEKAVRERAVSESGDAPRVEVRLHRARSRQVVRFIVRRLIVILPMVLVVVSVTITVCGSAWATRRMPIPSRSLVEKRMSPL